MDLPITVNMNPDEKEPSPSRPRGIPVIIFWLLFSASGDIYRLIRMGTEMIVSPLATIEFTYVLCAWICALGLLLKKDWARKFTILFFTIYFCRAIIVANYLGAPFFKEMAEEQHLVWMMDAKTLKNILLTCMILYILWPVIVVFYLSYPSVKNHFYQPSWKKIHKDKSKD